MRKNGNENPVETGMFSFKEKGVDKIPHASRGKCPFPRSLVTGNSHAIITTSHIIWGKQSPLWRRNIGFF